MASESADLHRVVVVGGGAGGLELVTRLGDTLGRREAGGYHADRQVSYSSVEAAAARGRGRQHGSWRA